jgi:RNA polymerase sigma-70 factor (ECF subfamily)
MIETLPDQVDWFALTTRIMAGEEAAFACFYNHFFDRLYRYTLVMTRGDEDLSKELMQKTMLKVVRYLKPLKDETVLWSWLTQLAKTSFIDILRSQKRAPKFVPLDLVSDARQLVETINDSDSVLESALEQAVALLAPDEKQLIQAVYFEEFSHKQIAKSTQSSPKAVESKLARVRQKLRGMMTRNLKDEK